MTKKMVPIPMRAMHMTVQSVSGQDIDALSIGHRDDRVVIALSRGGETLFAILAGDALDTVAGVLADAICAATRADAPSLGSVQ